MLFINPGRNFNLYQVEDGMKSLRSGISHRGRSSAYVSMKKLNNYKQWMHSKAPLSLSHTEMYHLLFVCTLACSVIQKKSVGAWQLQLKLLTHIQFWVSGL